MSFRCREDPQWGVRIKCPREDARRSPLVCRLESGKRRNFGILGLLRLHLAMDTVQASLLRVTSHSEGTRKFGTGENKWEGGCSIEWQECDKLLAYALLKLLGKSWLEERFSRFANER